MKKLYTVLLASLSFFATNLNADIITLNNGDIITGTIENQLEDKIVLNTSYGVLNIDKALVKEISVPSKTKAVKEDKLALALSNPAAAIASTNITNNASNSSKEEALEEERSWRDDYVDYINQYTFGWKSKFKAGFDYKNTNSSYTAYNLAFATEKVIEEHTIKFELYYEYTTETPEFGDSYVSTDKYGAVNYYRYDFNKDTNWFLTNELNYRRDTVKLIEHEVNEIVEAGYTFKYFEDDLVLNLSGGPGLKYIQAIGYDTPYVAIASVTEDLTWKFYDWLRMEQKLSVQLNMQETSQYYYYLMFGLVISPNPVFDLVLRYSYQYDGINSDDALKSESRIIFGVEIPLGWDK